MFCKNLTNTTLKFRAHNEVLELVPGVNIVDTAKWSVEELKKTYGPARLSFYDDETVEPAVVPAPEVPVVEETPVVDEAVAEAPVEPVEEVKPEAPKAKKATKAKNK